MRIRDCGGDTGAKLTGKKTNNSVFLQFSGKFPKKTKL